MKHLLTLLIMFGLVLIVNDAVAQETSMLIDNQTTKEIAVEHRDKVGNIIDDLPIPGGGKMLLNRPACAYEPGACGQFRLKEPPNQDRPERPIAVIPIKIGKQQLQSITVVETPYGTSVQSNHE